MEGYVVVYSTHVCWYKKSNQDGSRGGRHRTGGPATVWLHDDRGWARHVWYLDGVRLTEEEFNERRKIWKDT